MKYAVGCVLLFLMTACTARPTITVRDTVISQTEIEQGQQIYAQNCASCHGAQGEGQFPEAPSVPDTTGRRGAPPHTDAGHTWHHGDELLIAYVKDGGMGDPDSFYPMPAFGDKLTETDIIHVIAYLKTMWSDQHRAYQAQATESEKRQ